MATKSTQPELTPSREVWRKVNDLLPYANNARTHTEDQVAQIAASIKEFGWTNPIIIHNDTVVAGHARLAAARKLGMDKVPCIDRSDMSEAQWKAYVLADNRLAQNAGWDDGLLKLELMELDSLDFDLDLIGFDEKELDALLAPDPVDGLTDADEVPEDVEPVTQPGDLWVLGEHRLLCGDATKAEDVERVLDGAKPEMMFTDPPYGVNYEGGHFHSGDVNIKRKREKLAADDSTDIYGEFLPIALQHIDGPCYLWFAGSKALPVYQAVHDCGGVVSALLIWHKTNATYAAMNAQYKQRHEPCLYFKPKQSTLRWVGPSDAATLWEFKRDGQNTFHPTQKPVALADNALKNHNAKSVADFFLGSGTTLIAAERQQRRGYFIEIDPHYVDVAVARWENFTGKKGERIGSTS